MPAVAVRLPPPPSVQPASVSAVEFTSAVAPVLLSVRGPWKLLKMLVSEIVPPLSAAAPLTDRKLFSPRMPPAHAVSVLGAVLDASVRLPAAFKVTSPPGSLYVTVPPNVLATLSMRMGPAAVKMVRPPTWRMPSPSAPA